MFFKRVAPVVTALAVAATVSSAAISLNMTLEAQKDDYAGSYSDIWGYTSPAGVEYAIIGHQNGTIFYNISDPANPVEVGYIPGPNSIWRDIKVNGPYAFIVTEGSGTGTGMQTVSLADPENPVLVNTWDLKFTTAHNIFIDTTRSLAYVCGTAKGMHVVDISDPVNPVQTKIWRAIAHYYIHDLMVVNDTVWAAAINEGFMHILANPDSATLQEVVSWTYAGSASHAGWLHTDNRYFISTDETSGGHIRIWDVSDKLNITQVSSYEVGVDRSVHNVFVKGQLAFISYYTEGTRVLDVSDPFNPVEAAYYDTYIGGGLYNGNWGVFPYFNSGTIISSDMSGGLFVFSLDTYTGVDDRVRPVPGIARLLPATPNPFNPVTELGFSGGGEGIYRLQIYSVDGRLVRTLFQGRSPGESSGLYWDGTDDRGTPVGSGSYLYRLTGPNTVDQKKMVLIR